MELQFRDIFLKQKEAIRKRSLEVFALIKPGHLAFKPEPGAWGRQGSTAVLIEAPVPGSKVCPEASAKSSIGAILRMKFQWQARNNCRKVGP